MLLVIEEKSGKRGDERPTVMRPYRQNFWAGWLTPARPTPSPVPGDGQPAVRDDASDRTLSTPTTADTRASLDRSVLRERMRALRTAETGVRVQKNLTLLRTDADRLSQLSRRDRTSQARILALALDCYEQAYGHLPDDSTNDEAQP